MTAQTSRPDAIPAIELSPEACVAVDRLVERHGADVASAAGFSDEVRAALTTTAEHVCAEARKLDAARAERLVLALRATWPTLPAVQQAPSGVDRALLLDRLVAACISAFYRSRAR